MNCPIRLEATREREALVESKEKMLNFTGQAGFSATCVKQMLKNTATVLGVGTLSPKEQKHGATIHNPASPAPFPVCLSFQSGTRWQQVRRE